MKLGDLIVFVPGAFLGTFAKTIRTNLPAQTKKYVAENHLYHFASKKETIGKILQSGYIKAGTKIGSYGKEACFMFGGMPNMDAFIKNMTTSPYVNPDRIFHALEIDVTEDKLNNYKIRPFADEALIFEGYCVLEKDKARAVEIIADLKRDEQGKPKIDPKTGEYEGIELRKRTEEEIKQSPDKYIPSNDYLEYIKEKQKKIGYSQGQGNLSILYNKGSNVLAGGKLEYNETVRSTKKNFFIVIKELISRFKNRKMMLDESPETKIKKVLNGKTFLRRKNPYADKKFAISIANFLKNGLIQYDLEEALPQFVNSKDGLFLRDKFEQIDKSKIKQNGIHGIKHNNRVAILSLMIGQGEGVLKEESTRERELLVTAAYYHDIGRIGDVGPHASRGAKLIKNLKPRYIDGKEFSEVDKKIIQLLTEGHEGKDKKVEKLIKKYDIPKQDIGMVKMLLAILKDADALDRARLTVNTPIKTITDLDPRFLRVDTSKKLMEASYGLESLTGKVKIEDILNYRNENNKQHYYEREKPIDNLKISQPVVESPSMTKEPTDKTIENKNNIKTRGGREE